MTSSLNLPRETLESLLAVKDFDLVTDPVTNEGAPVWFHLEEAVEPDERGRPIRVVRFMRDFEILIQLNYPRVMSAQAAAIHFVDELPTCFEIYRDY